MTPAPSADLARLRARFFGLMLLLGAAAVIGLALLAGYFAFHLPWCLPLFALDMAGAALGQIAFIAAFGRETRKEA